MGAGCGHIYNSVVSCGGYFVYRAWDLSEKMTKLEEVARALVEAHHEDDLAHVFGPWDELGGEFQRVWLETARAAVEALREPDEGMYEAGVTAIKGTKEYWGELMAMECWQAMLTAILEEG